MTSDQLDKYEYTVWVGGTEINDNLLLLDSAIELANEFIENEYKDVYVVNVTTNKIIETQHPKQRTDTKSK